MLPNCLQITNCLWLTFGEYCYLLLFQFVNLLLFASLVLFCIIAIFVVHLQIIVVICFYILLILCCCLFIVHLFIKLNYLISRDHLVHYFSKISRKCNWNFMFCLTLYNKLQLNYPNSFKTQIMYHPVHYC